MSSLQKQKREEGVFVTKEQRPRALSHDLITASYEPSAMLAMILDMPPFALQVPPLFYPLTHAPRDFDSRPI